MEIIGTIIAAIAAFAAVASAIVAHKQKKAADGAALDAQNEAAAATAAAQRASAAAEASAEAHTKLADIAETEATAAPWKIEHVTGSAYSARNDGPIRLYDVSISVTGFAATRKQSTSETVDPGASLRFMAMATMQEPVVSATIAWANTPGGEQLTWTDQIT